MKIYNFKYKYQYKWKCNIYNQNTMKCFKYVVKCVVKVVNTPIVKFCMKIYKQQIWGCNI